MKLVLLTTVMVLIVCGCAAPTVTVAPPAGAAVVTREQAAIAAKHLTTIAGPWTVGDIEHGTYVSLWQGSTNDPTGQGAAARAIKNPLTVWRVDLSGPGGFEELYIDETNGDLLDWITQGQ